MRIYDFELDPEPVKLDGRVSWPAYTDGYSVWSPAEQHRSPAYPARAIMVHEIDGCLAREQFIGKLSLELEYYKKRLKSMEMQFLTPHWS